MDRVWDRVCVHDDRVLDRVSVNVFARLNVCKCRQNLRLFECVNVWRKLGIV